VVESAVENNEDAGLCLAALEEVRRDGVLQENRRRNLGAIVAAAVSTARTLSDITLDSLAFVNVSFGKSTIHNVRILNCTFQGTHWEHAQFVDCLFEKTSVAESICVSKETKLGIAGLVPGENLYCVISLQDGREIYAPSEMTSLLQQLGAPLETEDQLYSKAGQAVNDLLHRIIRRYRRSNLICLQDRTMKRLFEDRSWPLLHDLLVEHQIVTEETRETSGRRKAFLRSRVAIPELMKYENRTKLPAGNIGAFWRSIRGL
jgi:hypothetical protein